MTEPDNAEIEETILERLKNGEDRNNIILDLCERENMSWPEAEAMLEKIHAERNHHIVLAQSPALAVISLGTFIGGIAAVLYSVYNIVVIFLSYQQAAGGEIAFVGMILYLFTYGGLLWGVVLIGLGMIVGSLKGMQDVWAAIFKKLGIFQGHE